MISKRLNKQLQNDRITYLKKPVIQNTFLTINTVVNLPQKTPSFKQSFTYPFISKSTTNDIRRHFLGVLCEYKAALVVWDDLQPIAKDGLFLN